MLRASLLTSHASCNQMLLTMTPLILCSINWPNFIAWLPLQLNILGNMCIAIVVFSGCETINFEINWNFENCVRPEKAASKRTWLIRQILKDPFYALFAVVKPSLVFFWKPTVQTFSRKFLFFLPQKLIYQRVQNWDLKYNTANVVFFSTIYIKDNLFVSDEYIKI